MPRPPFPSELEELFGVSVTEDWPEEFDTPEESVTDAARWVSPPRLIGALGEIELIIASGRLLEDVQFLSRNFSCNYLFDSSEHVSGWLLGVRDRIAAATLARSTGWPNLLDSARATLETVALWPPTAEPASADRALETATRLGTEAPIEEVITMLGLVSLMYAALTTTSDERNWLDTIRTAAATPAAERWPLTST